MNRVVGLLVGSAALLCLPLGAQNHLTYERQQRENLWNDGINVAGIRLVRSQAWDAHAFAQSCNGRFHATNEADNCWSAGVLARADQSLEKFSMTGQFGFSQMQGSAMCGSMLADPGAYPIDVLEFTPGDKTLQTYTVDGGIAVDLTGRLVGGVNLNFRSQNYSKRKDLRHVDYKLDLEFAPSLMWRGNGWNLGASLILGKNTESVTAEQIGSAASSYHAFLDKGLMYGAYEMWTGSGLHLDEAGVTGLPFQELVLGGALQVGSESMFADLEYRHKTGKAGEKQFVWFRFPTDELTANLAWRINPSNTLRASAVASRLVNNEAVLEKETVGGVTNVLEHGSNRIMVKDVLRIVPEYEYRSDRLDVVAAAVYGLTSSTASQMYPLVISQKISEYGVSVDLVYRTGSFDLEGGLLWRSGSCLETESLLSSDSGLQSELFRLDEWNSRQIRYLTAGRSGANLGLRYHIGKIGYVSLEDRLAYAPKLGADGIRNIVELRFGRNF